MKNFLLIMLLAIASLSVSAQKSKKPTRTELNTQYKLKATTSVTLPDSVAFKGWVKDYVQKAIKDGGGVIPPPPEPGLDTCKRQPTIGSLTSITDTSAIMLYDAEGVYDLAYQVSNLSGQTLYTSSVQPKNNTPLIPFDKLTPGIYNLTIWGKSCLSKPNTKSFNIPVPPVVTEDCDRGPTIKRIQSFSDVAITLQYDGKNVFNLGWLIYNETGERVRNGSAEPKSNTLTFTYNKLDPGKYSIVLFGISCKGVSVPVLFEIKKDEEGGGGNPPPNPGDFKSKVVTSGFMEHMNLELKGNFNELHITDLANPAKQDNYDLVYMIGGNILRGVEPLKDYVIRPGQALRVLKYRLRKDIETLNRWPAGNEADSIAGQPKSTYWLKEAGELFSSNTSIAFSTIAFPNENKKDESGFLTYLDSRFNPETQQPQWAEIADNITLPKGHVFVANRGEWPISLVQSKGVTHIANGQLPWPDNDAVGQLKRAGQTYNDVPRPNVFMNLQPKGPDQIWVDGFNLQYWPRGGLSDEEAVRKAEETDTGHAIWIGETRETALATPTGAPMWRAFYSKLRERYENDFGKRGIPYYVCDNYFQLYGAQPWLNLGSENGAKERAAKTLLLSADKLPQTDFSPGGTLASTNLIVEGVYLGAPDLQIGGIYESIYRMTIFHKMGYETGAFLYGSHEWRPNNRYKINYPDGVFYQSDKMPLDPNVIVAYSFISHVYGKVYVEWGGGGKQLTKDYNNLNLQMRWSDGSWYWPGQTEDKGLNGFPHVTDNNPYYGGYTGSQEFSYFGQKLFCDSYAKVEGGTDLYLKFRIDEGQWIVPSQIPGQEAVDAYYDQRGFVHSRTLNGNTSWFYLNSYSDNKAHKIDVELPNGRIVSGIVSSNGIYAKNEF